MKKIKSMMIVLIILFSITACSSIEDTNTSDVPEFVSKSGFYLDTLIDIKIYDPNDSSESILEKSMNRIEELEQLLSIHINESDLSNIAENAGIKPVEVAEETFELIEKSVEYSKSSNGKFDITTGPLIDLWAIDPPMGHVPTDQELENVFPLIDYNKISLNKGNKTIYLEEEGMIANLGAIAKGYIADEVKEVLLDNGVESAIINLGGNILLVGEKPSGDGFRIGVQDPESSRGTYLGVIVAKDISVVSSGDYERYFEKDGKKYHHIIDPDTGYPTDNEISQVSILSNLSVDGDSLSTTTFLLGLDKAIEYVEQLEGIEAIFVTKDDKIHMTSGIDESFEFDGNNFGNKYTIIE